MTQPSSLLSPPNGKSFAYLYNLHGRFFGRACWGIKSWLEASKRWPRLLLGTTGEAWGERTAWRPPACQMPFQDSHSTAKRSIDSLPYRGLGCIALRSRRCQARSSLLDKTDERPHTHKQAKGWPSRSPFRQAEKPVPHFTANKVKIAGGVS